MTHAHAVAERNTRNAAGFKHEVECNGGGNLMIHDKILVDNRCIAIVDFGCNENNNNGETVLLLHGAMGRATCWYPIVDGLIGAGFRVIGVDQRGHGRSDKAETYEVDDFVADLEAVVEAYHSPVIIVGHSLGGLVACRFAARHGKYVKKIVIEDISCNGDRTNLDEYVEWFDKWPVPFSTISDIRKYFDSVRPGLGDYFQETFKEREDGYHPFINFEDVLCALSSISKQSFWDDLLTITCPALVIKGGKSDYPREELMEMADRLSQGTYCEIDNAFHVVHHDFPELWLQAVLPFLGANM